MTSNLTLLPVAPEQAKLLSDLAKEIYTPHYPYLWEAGGVEWYIHEYAYPLEKIQAELNDPNNLHYIAYQNNEPVGYIKLNINTKTAGFQGDQVMELERIYIYKEGVQKGINFKSDG